jgi:hypothetical protein
VVGFLGVVLTSYFIPVQLIANGAGATAERLGNISNAVALTPQAGNLIPFTLT